MPKDEKRQAYVTAKPREDSIADADMRGYLYGNPGSEYARLGLPEERVDRMNKRDIGRMRDAEELLYQIKEQARRAGIWRPEMERHRVEKPKPELDVEFGEPAIEGIAPPAPQGRQAHVTARPRELSVDEAALKRSVLDVAGRDMTPAERQFVMRGAAVLPTSKVSAMDRAAGVPALLEQNKASGGLTPEEQSQLQYLLNKAKGLQ